jgi:hypothetical protein
MSRSLSRNEQVARGRLDRFRNRFAQLQLLPDGDDKITLLRLLEREVEAELPKFIGRRAPTFFQKNANFERNIMSPARALLDQIRATLPPPPAAAAAPAPVPASPPLPASVRNRARAFGSRIAPGASVVTGFPRARPEELPAMAEAGAAAGVRPRLGSVVSVNNGPPSLIIENTPPGRGAGGNAFPVAAAEARPALAPAVAAAANEGMGGALAAGVPVAPPAGNLPAPNFGAVAPPAGNNALAAMRARLGALSGPPAPANGRSLRNRLVAGRPARPAIGPAVAPLPALPAVPTGAIGGPAPGPAPAPAPAPAPGPGLGGPPAGAAGPSGIAPYVKNTLVPLKYDMETCELVAAADRKGVAQGFLEARGKSLNLLSQSVRALVMQERALSYAESGPRTVGIVKKAVKADLDRIRKELTQKQSALASARKGITSYTSCAARGVRNIRGRSCTDMIAQYRAQEATLVDEIAALQAEETRAQGEFEAETRRKVTAEQELQALRSAPTSGIKSSRWPWGKRGGTRRRGTRRSTRRRTTRRRN